MKKLPFSAEELLYILEKTQFIVFIWKNEINWPVEYVSKNISQLGYSCEDFFSGKIKYSDLIHPDDIERVEKEVKKYSTTLTPEFQQEYRILNNLNQIIWVHDRTIIKTDKNGKITHYQGFIIDITKKKEMQEQLQESMQKYQELIDQAKSIILRLDENLIITFANDFAIKFFGFSEEELVGHIVSDTIIPKRDTEGKNLLKMLSLVKKKPKSYHNNINENIKKNGERVWISWTNNALYDKNGNKKGFLSIGNDITDLRKAEQVIQESEEKYSKLFNLSFDPIVLHNRKGNIFEVNKKFIESLGYSKKEILSKNLNEFFFPIPKSINFNPESYSSSFERTLQKKNGEKMDIEIQPKLLHINGKEIIQSILHDITEKKKAENIRLRMQKIESLALLAGGIAHDFNNLLVGILGNINLLQMIENSSSEANELLTDLESNTLKAKNLTEQLLTFSKGGAPITKNKSIIPLIKDSISLVKHGSKCKFFLQTESNLSDVEIDTGQISQVINNLLINAKQSMPQGGNINIVINQVELQNQSAIPVLDGEYLKIQVSDQGKGIPIENRKHIFIPYFTTKSTGTGLGLATSYSIIKKHHGYITFTTELNKGTTFIIYLPVSSKQNITEKKSLKEKSFPISKKIRGKVLIMDDDQKVLEILRKMLNKMGFEITSTVNGHEAIEIYKKMHGKSEPFDFIIMDLTIPAGMGGKEAIKEILQINPEVKAIVASGYSNDPIMAQYKKFGFTGVLRKPFTFHELSDLISSLLT